MLEGYIQAVRQKHPIVHCIANYVTATDCANVLLAIGVKHGDANGSVRFSLGEGNDERQVDRVVELLTGIVARLRAMSPLWERIIAQEK